MEFLNSGKVKDIYDMGNDTLLFNFSNRVSAYDVKFHDEIPKKGQVLCKFAQFWFEQLDVETHFVKAHSDTEIIVKKMQMLPIECVVRGYFYGSMVNRWKSGEIILPEGTNTELATKLPTPVFDPTTKSEHDMPITKDDAIKQNLVTIDEYDWLSEKSIQIYNKMSLIADAAGFILADLKLEFGKLDGKITLGDSIGPDEYRLWPKSSYSPGKIQDAYDKQLLRDWLTEHGYHTQFEKSRANGQEPVAPQIPSELIQKMTDRYVAAYERTTGLSL
jgi:phosphoribosylaminoimidazole-succinocarboxamide synthase